MTVLCAVDTSTRAVRVAQTSRHVAELLGAEAVLTHVFDPMMVPVPPTRELHRELTGEQIEAQERRIAHAALVDVAQTAGFAQEATVFAEGTPQDQVVRLAAEHDARLLVVGSAAREPLERLMKGSTAADVVREAPCPVVVVTDEAHPCGSGPVLAGYDGSEHSLRAARHAAALAAALQRTLVLAHVVAPGEEGARADDDLARELHDAAGASAGSRGLRLDPAVLVDHGDPARRLVDTAVERDASVIVVGNRGRGSLTAAVLGSVSAGVVRLADRPVVVAGPRSEQAVA